MPEDSAVLLIRAEPALSRLAAILTKMGSVAIAYSGGVDSTFLLKVACAVLGENAQGFLAVSESLDRNELKAARQLAREQGFPLVEIETHEYENPLYRQNTPQRCYHCKNELFNEVSRFAKLQGFCWVLDGSHAGDVGDYRPGLKARDEQGVRSPLMEAGIDKEDIRRFSRLLGLPTWNKPAAPCLSSRIPYGSEVSHRKLRQVEALEEKLSSLGFEIRRARHYGDEVRIEVPLDRLDELMAESVFQQVEHESRRIGFLSVTVDPEGFR
ncbi:MAG: ATP-dependent sacrificial sulfur transferase LarE, partial [Planctomycetota bacterium]